VAAHKRELVNLHDWTSSLNVNPLAIRIGTVCPFLTEAQMPACRLCKKERALVKAHIIPESMYPFEEDQREPLSVLYSDTQKPQGRSPKGEYDQNLVCRACEEKFSPWDGYAAHIMHSKPDSKDYLRTDNQKGLDIFESYSYEKLKLFFVSLLWKTSESTREAFSQVDVGKKYTKKLVQMIKDGDPGYPEEFASLLIRLTHPYDAHKIVMTPIKHR